MVCLTAATRKVSHLKWPIYSKRANDVIAECIYNHHNIVMARKRFLHYRLFISFTYSSLVNHDGIDRSVDVEISPKRYSCMEYSYRNLRVHLSYALITYNIWTTSDRFVLHTNTKTLFTYTDSVYKRAYICKYCDITNVVYIHTYASVIVNY